MQDNDSISLHILNTVVIFTEHIKILGKSRGE